MKVSFHGDSVKLLVAKVTVSHVGEKRVSKSKKKGAVRFRAAPPSRASDSSQPVGRSVTGPADDTSMTAPMASDELLTAVPPAPISTDEYGIAKRTLYDDDNRHLSIPARLWN